MKQKGERRRPCSLECGMMGEGLYIIVRKLYDFDISHYVSLEKGKRREEMIRNFQISKLVYLN